MVTDSPDGEPIVSMVISNKMMTRETLTLKKGDIKSSCGITFGFSSAQPADINISLDSGKFFMSTNLNLGEMSIMTQESAALERGKPVLLKQMQIFTLDDIKIVPQQMSVKGVIKAVAVLSLIHI